MNKKIYYIVTYNAECWQPFLENSYCIDECYKINKKYITIYNYHQFDSSCDVMLDSFNVAKKSDFYFNISKELIFLYLKDAKEFAKEKIDEMYLSRCKHLVIERDNALLKLEKENA